MTLTTFYQDRNRARERVAMLEHQADAFSRQGKTVPAAALARQARIIQYLWCLTQCDDVNDRNKVVSGDGECSWITYK